MKSRKLRLAVVVRYTMIPARLAIGKRLSRRMTMIWNLGDIMTSKEVEFCGLREKMHELQ